MKKNIIIYCCVALVTVFGGTSCKKYLDINKNPNQPIASTPQLLIPQAITATGSFLSAYNTYGAQSGMYMANAGGYGGFGSNVTYNFSTSNYAGLWNLFDVNEDFYLAKNLSADDPSLIYFNAIARIMLAHKALTLSRNCADAYLELVSAVFIAVSLCDRVGYLL